MLCCNWAFCASWSLSCKSLWVSACCNCCNTCSICIFFLDKSFLSRAFSLLNQEFLKQLGLKNKNSKIYSREILNFKNSRSKTSKLLDDSIFTQVMKFFPEMFYLILILIQLCCNSSIICISIFILDIRQFCLILLLTGNLV